MSVPRIRAFVPGIVSAAAVSTVATLASALPAPMTEQELIDNSDLVVDATATKAVCDGPAVEDSLKVTETYLTDITVTATSKGTAPAAPVVRGYVESYKQGNMCAASLPAVEKGFVGRLYLKQASDGKYEATHYNGVSPDSALSKPEALPDCGAPAGTGGAAGSGGASSGGTSSGGASSGGTSSGGAGSGGTSSGGSAGNAGGGASDDDGGGCSIDNRRAERAANAFAAIGLVIAAAAARRRRAR